MEEKYFYLTLSYHDGLTAQVYTTRLNYDLLVLSPGGFLGLTSFGFKLLEASGIPSEWYAPIPKAKLGALLHPRPGVCITINSPFTMSANGVKADSNTMFLLYAGQVLINGETDCSLAYWHTTNVPGAMPMSVFKALQLQKSLEISI